MKTIQGNFILFLLTIIFLTACSAANATNSCPVTEPIWDKPPYDTAVGGESPYGYYIVNEDRSIWSSSWWTDDNENYLRADGNGTKVGWFRPEGAELQITGRRLDGDAPPLESNVPCCYPTRFQSSGLYFPTEGCWEVTAKAEDSILSYVVWVEP